MSTLYDAPGPRARRLTVITSALVAVLLAISAYLFVYRPLDAQQQFTYELWGPLLDPTHESFPLVWQRLGAGLRATLLAALLAITASLIVGTGLAILRIQLIALRDRRYQGLATPLGYALRVLTVLLNAVTRFFVEVFRGMPVVITIFFVSVGLPSLGLDLGSALGYLVVGLTLYNSVVIAEILRSGMSGLPRGQGEAAQALGLSPFATTRMILLPQAYRIMLPALISQLVVILKDTSLGFIISYEEVLRVSSQIVQVLENPIQVYTVVGVGYLLINYTLSRIAGYTERRIAQGRTARGLTGPDGGAGAKVTLPGSVGPADI